MTETYICPFCGTALYVLNGSMLHCRACDSRWSVGEMIVTSKNSAYLASVVQAPAIALIGDETKPMSLRKDAARTFLLTMNMITINQATKDGCEGVMRLIEYLDKLRYEAEVKNVREA